MLKLAVLAIALTTAAAPLTLSWNAVTSKTIEPGVVLTQMQQTVPPLLVDVVTIDRTANPDLRIEAQVADGSLTGNTGNIRLGRENVSSLAARTGALAAVNGDFFPYTGDPLGLGVTDGEIYSEPYSAPGVAGRAALGVLKSGRVIVGVPVMSAKFTTQNGLSIPIAGIDRLTSSVNPSDVVICSPLFGPTSGARGGGTQIVLTSARAAPLTPGASIAVTVQGVLIGGSSPAAIPSNGFVITLPAGSPYADQVTGALQIGQTARVTIDLSDATSPPLHSPSASWNGVVNAIGGGPILLQDGKIALDTAAEGIPDDIAQSTAARTGVGVCANGKIVIVAVDSGSALSSGITLAQFALLMQQLGVRDAINLDGGGSTTMVVGGQTVDFPSGSSWERPVADMLALYDAGGASNGASGAQVADRSIEDYTSRGNSSRSEANTQPDAVAGSATLNPVLLGPLSITPIPAGASVGSSIQLSVQGDGITVGGGDPALLWSGPVGSVGFVAQNGVFHILNPGQGTLAAKYKGELITENVTIAAPAPVPTPSVAPMPGPDLLQRPAATPTPTPDPGSDDSSGQMNRD